MKRSKMNSLMAITMISIMLPVTVQAGWLSRAFSSINNVLNPLSPSNPANPVFILANAPNPFLDNTAKYPVSAHWELFMLGSEPLIHTMNCFNGECRTVSTGGILNPNSNPHQLDVITKKPIITQIIAGSQKLVTEKQLCMTEKQASNNAGSACFMGIYGVHGVCHTFTERTMEAYGSSMGSNFSAIETSSGNRSGRLSFMVYGRFGIPYNPAQNWSTCKALAETSCTVSSTFRSGPGVAATSYPNVYGQAVRAPASVTSTNQRSLPSYKANDFQIYEY